MGKRKLKVNPDYCEFVKGVKDALAPSEVLNVLDTGFESAVDRSRYVTGVLIEVDNIGQAISYQRVLTQLVDGKPDIESIKKRYRTYNKAFFTREYFLSRLH